MNPGLPQTLQIAVFLLYFRAGFGLLELLIAPDFTRALADSLPGGLFFLLAIVVIQVAGGKLTANNLHLGYNLALAGALAPFVMRLIAYRGIDGLWATGPIGLLFDVALVVVILHPMSREYRRLWFE